jgi:hypothetical protein
MAADSIPDMPNRHASPNELVLHLIDEVMQDFQLPQRWNASASDPLVLAGLGASTAVPRVCVCWPSGHVENGTACQSFWKGEMNENMAFLERWFPRW